AALGGLFLLTRGGGDTQTAAIEETVTQPEITTPVETPPDNSLTEAERLAAAQAARDAEAARRERDEAQQALNNERVARQEAERQAALERQRVAEERERQRQRQVATTSVVGTWTCCGGYSITFHDGGGFSDTNNWRGTWTQNGTNVRWRFPNGERNDATISGNSLSGSYYVQDGSFSHNYTLNRN
ncbi:MAG: hypothetical protein AB7O04_13495, partial [Hyphomonadaceae bacterium]